jgi:hypothetical protein
MSKNIVGHRERDTLLCSARGYVAPTTAKSLCNAIAHPSAVSDLAYARHSKLAN